LFCRWFYRLFCRWLFWGREAVWVDLILLCRIGVWIRIFCVSGVGGWGLGEGS
jgi:hypothetical protein